MRKRHLPHRYKEGERSAVFRFRNRRRLGTPMAACRHGRFFLPQWEEQSRRVRQGTRLLCGTVCSTCRKAPVSGTLPRVILSARSVKVIVFPGINGSFAAWRHANDAEQRRPWRHAVTGDFCCLTAFGPNDETVMFVSGCTELPSHSGSMRFRNDEGFRFKTKPTPPAMRCRFAV